MKMMRRTYHRRRWVIREFEGVDRSWDWAGWGRMSQRILFIRSIIIFLLGSLEKSQSRGDYCLCIFLPKIHCEPNPIEYFLKVVWEILQWLQKCGILKLLALQQPLLYKQLQVHIQSINKLHIYKFTWFCEIFFRAIHQLLIWQDSK